MFESAESQPFDLYILMVVLAVTSLLTYFRVISQGYFVAIGLVLVGVVILQSILDYQGRAW